MKNTTIEAKSAPAYLQLYRQMREDIVAGIYPRGGRLPSKRLLADEAGVSTVTVEHAYALLYEEGYIEPRERSGYFVIFRPSDGFAGTAEPMRHPRPVPHAPGEETEFPFPQLAKVMRRVISDYGPVLLERSPGVGRPELRSAIGQYLARSRGIRVDTEQIVIGSGSEHLYGRIVEMFGRERKYAIESPSYKKIEQVYRAAEVPLEMLPLGQDGIESAALWRTDAQVLHISPYRSFPSGVTASASKRHEYLRWAHPGRYIIEDDFESEFSVSRKPEETLFSHTAEDNVIYMNTFSKTLSPGMRVGYMVLPRQLLPVFAARSGFYSCTVPTFEQLLLAELLEGGDFERHINRVRRKKRKEIE